MEVHYVSKLKKEVNLLLLFSVFSVVIYNINRIEKLQPSRKSLLLRNWSFAAFELHTHPLNPTMFNFLVNNSNMPVAIRRLSPYTVSVLAD